MQRVRRAMEVKVFDGATQRPIADFFAFDVHFAGGVRVGAGGLDGDGLADVVLGAGPGGAPTVGPAARLRPGVARRLPRVRAGLHGRGVFVGGAVPEPNAAPAALTIVACLACLRSIPHRD
jgi:hypothetical protein